MTLFYDFGKFCKKKCLTDLVKFFILTSMIFCVVGCNLDTVTEEKNTTGTIQGTVIYDNATVSDYSGIQVSLFSSNGLMASNNCISRTIVTKSRSLESVGITNSKGEYIFENVPEGVYTIYASSNSSTQKAVATNVVVRASETVTPDVLGLTATGSLEGYVEIDYSTDGVLGLDVFIPGTSFIAKVDGTGYFKISNIPIDTGYELYIQKGDKVLKLCSSEDIDNALTNSGYLGYSYLDSAELGSCSIRWLGSFWEVPENPELYDAYFNMIDNCSYIWDGNFWDSFGTARGINWRGSWTSHEKIHYPDLYDAYYNEKDGCSYIYTEDGWVLLAKGGADGLSINWRGSYTSSDNISNPQHYDAYFNTTDGCSYIYNSTCCRWELLVKSNNGINWLGEYYDSSSISNPQNFDAYYDCTTGCSYIYMNGWWYLLAEAGRDGEDGVDGVSINWRGNYSSSDDIYAPQYFDAYYNTSDGCSYIYTWGSWQLLAKAGEDGVDGVNGDTGASIKWRGSYSTSEAIYEPQYLDAYYNSTDGCSYIYTTDNTWCLLARNGIDGIDGTSIKWRGSFYSNPNYPRLLDAYYNTTDGCSYIYTEDGWKLLAQKGDTGENGVSIKWLGSYTDSSKISNPKVLNAYYNTTDGCSYIYTGSSWQLLARKGSDGATSSGDGSIRWLGSFVDFNEVPNPDAMDAFFNETTGCSYIYNGTEWILLAQSGADGAAGNDGISINWLGSYANTNFIHGPKYLDAYWNTTENCAYIYDGEKWTVLAKGPASGGSGSTDPTIGTEAGANIVGTTLVSWENPQGVIRIPNGVTDIAEGVFYNKDDITRVIIPSSVVSIGKEAFYDCYNLTSVEFLGPGLKIIGESAFAGCENLANIVLPNTLTTIGIAAFMYCKNITTVNIPNSVVTIGNDAYRYCSMLRTLTIGSGVTNLEEYIFGDCDTLTSVTIPDNVLRISVRLFVECDSLSEVHASGTWSDNEGNSNKVITVEDLKRSDYMAGYSDITWTRDTN